MAMNERASADEPVVQVSSTKQKMGTRGPAPVYGAI